MSISTWDEIRTAYHVARMGTVSGAADALGVHHATVIRHIDALEQRLGVKLFQRHARGYTSTEAGQDLLQVAQATDDQFTQLVGRLKGRGDSVTGDLVVTSISSFSPLFSSTTMSSSSYSLYTFFFTLLLVLLSWADVVVCLLSLLAS